MAETPRIISLDPGALEGIQMVRNAASDWAGIQESIMRELEEVAFTGQARRAFHNVSERWCYLMARELRLLQTFGDDALAGAQRMFEAEEERARKATSLEQS
ncbi:MULTISPECIES: hypothetical protein [Streptomyces]|uniref:Uncharacterized protein n=1 Tax=Streptomyces viridochromogenes TaxID=1938 RepID=A0A0L8KE74_STRVR|nr:MULTISPECIES: hypothetical protein [Streptomyces]KOG24233.1 hypothetical protein ADK34_19240 [Streptomyces viridochromogenes]